MRHPLPAIVALLFIATLFAGCAADPGIVQVGTGIYLIEKQSSTAVLGTGGMRSAAIDEANTYCQRHSGTAEILEETETDPTRLPGRTSRVEVRFRCNPWP